MALETSAWAFGWEALVAIGTLLLATATVVLALVTRRVATATKDEVASQSRPVLLPCEIDLLDAQGIRVTDEEIVLRIRNGGKGPAFEIHCLLGPDELIPDDWSHGILEQDREAGLRFAHDGLNAREEYELLMRYRDLAGRDYSSLISIKLIARRTNDEFRQGYAFQHVRTSAPDERKGPWNRLRPSRRLRRPS